MAFGKSTASSEGFVARKYTGVGSVFVKGVNPSREELSAFYGREIENSPEYIGTAQVGEDNVPRVRVQFLVQLDDSLKDQSGQPKYVNSDGSPIVDFKSTLNFSISKAHRYNKDKTKIQVVDKYGYSGWATKEQLAAKAQLLSSSGVPLRITTDYRPAYMGEVELIEFIKTYLGIKEARVYVNGAWINNPDVVASDCECCLDKIENYFKGDFSELKTIVGLIPTNKVKVLFGVRSADDGRLIQVSYTNTILRNSSKDYSSLDKEIQEAKAQGRLATTEYDCKDLHEYVVVSSDLSEPAPDPAGFGNPWD